MTLSPDQARELQELGYFIVPGALSGEEVNALTEALVAVEGRSTDALPGSATASWTPVLDEYRIYNFPECDQVFCDLIASPGMIGPIQSIIPGPVHLTEAFTTSRRRGPGVPMHRVPFANFRMDGDRPRTDHAKVMVLLTDCGPEDGPIVMVEGSHVRDDIPPFDQIHPGWTLPPWDEDYVARLRSELGDTGARRPWEEIPGYKELYLSAGDAVFFTEDVWHGAKWLSSRATRRAVHLGYSPYHIAKWHGLSYSPELRQRATHGQRVLLEGPFVGHRLVDSDTEFALANEFPALPHSENARRMESPGSDASIVDDTDEMMRLVADRLRVHDGPRQGVCALHLTGPVGGKWAVDLGNGATPIAQDELNGADSVIEVSDADFRSLLHGVADPVELFNHGALCVRGDVSLAMRITDALIG
jgi:hypothetical protein